MDGSIGDRATTALAGDHRTGHLAGVDDEGRVLFCPEGHHGEPIAVAIGLPLSDVALLEAARQGRRAIVLRADGADGTERFVLVGLVRERLSGSALRREGLDARLDGEVVRLEAKGRIELVCGEASLILEADGRVTISGTHVVSSSRGANKIKGATISLN